MKNTYIVLLAASFLIALISCEKDGNEPEKPVALQESYESNEVEYSLLDYTPNVYHKYFKYSDKTIGFSSIKNAPFSEHFNSQRNQFLNGDEHFDIIVDKFSVSGKKGGHKMAKDQIGDIFGRNVSIAIAPVDGTKFKNGKETQEVTMYIPEKITITNPIVETEADILPYCYYKDFVLEWNADPKNEEGLVVVAEYFGANVIPNKDRGPAIVNADVLEEDNGKAVLDNDLWEGIPDTAVVYLSLLRGNIELEEVDGEIIKFYAETHAELPLVLIKDPNTIEFAD